MMSGTGKQDWAKSRASISRPPWRIMATGVASPNTTTRPPGDDEWREDEEGETDTPENTGSKVGPGRDDLQP
jgi:hypothetical protein